MKQYQEASRVIVWRFLRHRLTFAQCIDLLDSALSDLEPRLAEAEMPALRALVLFNNDTVMLEMERRAAPIR
jgi:hypothetical protein